MAGPPFSRHMRNPRRSRTIALIFFGSGLVTATAAFALPGLSEGDWLRACLFLVGVSAVIFGGGSALFRHFDVRAKEKLGRGEDVIARWRVAPEAWRAFVAMDQKWNEQGGANLYNELSLPAEVSAEGVEVIAGRSAIQVGESIHRVSGGVPEVTDAFLHDLQPAVIEMRLYYPGGDQGGSGVPRSPHRSALRLPVASGSWKEANGVVAHYRGDTPRRADFFHGSGDGSDQEDLTRCYNCGYETYKLVSHCPRCGRSMQSKRWSRRYGLALVFLGAIISGVIGVVLFYLFSRLNEPGGLRFSGTKAEEQMALGILGLLETFGVTVFSYGLWQVMTGRRSKWVIYFVIGIAAAVVLLALFL